MYVVDNQLEEEMDASQKPHPSFTSLLYYYYSINLIKLSNDVVIKL